MCRLPHRAHVVISHELRRPFSSTIHRVGFELRLPPPLPLRTDGIESARKRVSRPITRHATPFPLGEDTDVRRTFCKFSTGRFNIFRFDGIDISRCVMECRLEEYRSIEDLEAARWTFTAIPGLLRSYLGNSSPPLLLQDEFILTPRRP